MAQLSCLVCRLEDSKDLSQITDYLKQVGYSLVSWVFTEFCIPRSQHKAKINPALIFWGLQTAVQEHIH